MKTARALASLAALGLCVASAAFGQSIDDMDEDGAEGGCVSNRQVYAEDAELCQDGTLMRCSSGSWGAIGNCKDRPGQQPISQGGNSVEPEADDGIDTED